MPVPRPNKGESRKKFIGRCFGFLTSEQKGKSKSERMEANQKAAICHGQWRKSKSGTLSNDDLPTKGMFVRNSHSKMIMDKKKTMIVKNSLDSSVLNKELLLVDNNFAHGVVKVTNIKALSPREFKILYPEHQLSMDDSTDFWNNKTPLYGYTFEVTNSFTSTIDTIIPTTTSDGTVTVDDVVFLTEDMKFQPDELDWSSLSNQEIYFDDFILHRLWSLAPEERGDMWTDEMIISEHKKAMNEMSIRDITHPEYSDDLIEESISSPSEEDINSMLFSSDDIIIGENLVSTIIDGDEMTLFVNSNVFSEDMKTKIKVELQEKFKGMKEKVTVVYAEEPIGIPIMDLIIKRRGKDGKKGLKSIEVENTEDALDLVFGE